MNSIDILKNLQLFHNLMDELHEHELDCFENKENFIKLRKILSIEYSFITIELKALSKEPESSERREQLVVKVRFELNESTVHLKELYCEDRSRESVLGDWIKGNKNLTDYRWKLIPDASLSYGENISRYLVIADSIAKRTQNCASGDNYRPGYFSKILIGEESIVLSQANFMNSKSLDHKDSYSMRELKFTIAIAESEENRIGYDHQIGKMGINFSDRSSEKYRSCGEAIKEQIELEKTLYDNRQ